MENLRPNVFLMLFAVHADYIGFGADLSRLDGFRLSGNPCLVTDVVWHKERYNTFIGSRFQAQFKSENSLSEEFKF